MSIDHAEIARQMAARGKVTPEAELAEQMACLQAAVSQREVLLEACKAAVDCLMSIPDVAGGPVYTAIQKGRAAIAKAEGAA